VAISTVHRGFDIGAFLPDDIAAALRRRVREIGGLALIGVAILATAALASWSVKDPSLSYASGGSVRNLLGTGGAIACGCVSCCGSPARRSWPASSPASRVRPPGRCRPGSAA
jgi:hypothetical protein